MWDKKLSYPISYAASTVVVVVKENDFFLIHRFPKLHEQYFLKNIY